MKATYICPKCEVEIFDMQVYMDTVSNGNSGILETYGSSEEFCAKDNFGGEWETF